VGFFPDITPAFLDPDDAKKESVYEEQLRKQVAPEFLAACPDFMEYMTTAATKSVFIVYQGSWTGINGLEPLELQFKEDMPERHGSAVRNIPVLLREAAEKEFKRMVGYFFRPSKSSFVSPIVVAGKKTEPFVRVCGDFRALNAFCAVHRYPIPMTS
jgi:hypothetical protein